MTDIQGAIDTVDEWERGSLADGSNGPSEAHDWKDAESEMRRQGFGRLRGCENSRREDERFETSIGVGQVVSTGRQVVEDRWVMKEKPLARFVDCVKIIRPGCWIWRRCIRSPLHVSVSSTHWANVL